MGSKARTQGITISVTAETNAGCRRHMEDYLAVKLSPSEECSDLPHLKEQAYIGVFDGHGGKEAAKCARERLWDIIQKQPKYKLPDINSVKESLEEAFVALHKEMEPLRGTWKRNKTGDLSTAGTTASTVIFRQDHIFVANVGDSTAVLALNNPLAGQPNQHPIKALVLTKDHKPEDPEETKSIESLGGSVMTSRKGVPRVVWRRPRKSGEKEICDSIPFLSVSRSLGDFWSFNPRTNHFTVSPKPDVHVHPLNPKVQRFIVIASDGLWNVMTPDEVVQFIWDYECDKDTCHQPRDVVRATINEALRRWQRKHLPADNIAVLIAFLSEASLESSSDAVKADSEVAPATIEEEEALKASPSPSLELEVTTNRACETSSASPPEAKKPKLEPELPASPPEPKKPKLESELECETITKAQRVRTACLQRSPLSNYKSLMGKHGRTGEEGEGGDIPVSKRCKKSLPLSLPEVLDEDSGVCSDVTDSPSPPADLPLSADQCLSQPATA